MGAVHAFDVLGDPVRRALLDELRERGGGSVDAPVAAGELAGAMREAFGISQAAVSQHLGVLREHGFVTVAPAGRRRLYSIGGPGWAEVTDWVDAYRVFWEQRLDALETELRRGRSAAADADAADPADDDRSTP